MATHVGVILDKNYLAAVKLEGSSKNLVISDYACEIIPKQKEGEETDPYSYRAKLLDNFLKKHHFPRLSLYLVVSSEFCMLRQFTVPFLSDDQIKKTVRFEAESHIHSATIEEIEIQHMKIGEIKNRSELVVYGIRREALAETLRALKKYQIEPMGVDTPTSSISNYFVNRPEAMEDEPELWINIGGEDTTIAVIQKETLKYIRELKTGFPLPTKFMQSKDQSKTELKKVDAKPTKHDSDDAVVIINSGETKTVKELSKIFDPSKLVEKLNLEIKRTFVSLPSLNIKKIRIAGAGLVLEEVIESLKKYFPDDEIIECKNSMYKTKDNAKENTTLASQCLAVTMGSALKGFNLNKLNIDFRKGEFALKDAFEVLKAPLSVAVVLLMVLFFAIFLYFYQNRQDLNKLTDALHDDIKQIFESTYKISNKQLKKFPSDENKIVAIENAYFIMKKDFNTVSNFGSNRGLPEVHSVLYVWNEIFKKFDNVGRENPNAKNVHDQITPSREDPKEPDPKYSQMFKIEFSMRSIVIDCNIKRERFVVEGRCKDNIAVVNLRNQLNQEKELFSKVTERVSEITDTETIKRDKIYDTRPTFKIEGDILPPLSMVEKKN